MDDLDEWGTARLLTVAARLVEQDCNARLAEWDLTYSGLLLLTALLPGPVTQRDLGAALLLEDQAMSRAIDRLERAGLVTRTVSREDARSRRIRLTDAGFDLVNRLMDHHIANEQRLVSGLSERDRTQLAAILRRWGQALEGET